MSDEYDRNEADLKAHRLLEKHVDFSDPDGSTSMDGIEVEDQETRKSLEDQLDGLRILEKMLDFKNSGKLPARAGARVTIPEETPRLGRYALLGVVGKGAMGVVYRAAREGLDREVALKVLPPHYKLNPERVERFKREAHLASGLKHSGIVRVLDVDRHEGTWFYTMDLIEGNDLGTVLEMLERVGLVNLTEEHLPLLGGVPVDNVPAFTSAAARYVIHCVHLVSRLARSLAFAHEQGVLHRDLKPANIVLDRQGEPVITDFGLATPMDVDELTQNCMGTPHFLPPEVVEGVERPKPEQDIYSLGVILYRLLTLRFPFEGKSLGALMKSICAGEYTAPSRINSAVNRELEAIVHKTMHVDPESRYTSAADLAADLERYVRGRTIHAATPPVWDRFRRRLKRNPWMGVALVLAVVAMVELILLLLTM